MKRTLAVIFALAALVVAFHLGTLYGINMGVEEAMKFKPPLPSDCGVPWQV
jgi:hypothetical protein